MFRLLFHRQDTMTLVGRLSLVVTGLLLLLLIWTTWSHNLFDTYGLAPHGYCFLWNSQLVTLHVVSDMLIGLSYVFISGTLFYFVRSIYQDLPFRWIFLAFGGFIIACGATHFFDVWTLWYATYWLSGTVKLITAIASLSTAIILPPLIPKARILVTHARASEERKRELELAHQELEVLYQQAQQLNQFRTQFFASMSHELRTPLTLILSSVTLLMKDSAHSIDIEVIQRNTFTLLKRVNDLLDIAKFEANQVFLHYRRTDLVPVLQECLQHFSLESQRSQIQLIIQTPPALIAELDPDYIQRVFMNLLANAMRFTPSEGTITCTLFQEDSSLTFRIQDTGPGISSDVRQTLFEAFTQGRNSPHRHEGTGLGLAIVKELVTLHHGTISVSDNSDGGASFTVELPVFAPAEISLVAIQDDEENTSQKPSQWEHEPESKLAPLPVVTISQDHPPLCPSILIIEDHPEMVSYLTRLLASRYQTITAFDAVEGLSKAQTFHPDLILCDILLPGMNGDQLVKKIYADPALGSIPIIMLSAYSDDQLRVQLLQEGAQDYLVKPFLPEELYARIANLLLLQQTRQVLQRELTSQGQDIVSLSNELILRKHELKRALMSNYSR